MKTFEELFEEYEDLKDQELKLKLGQERDQPNPPPHQDEAPVEVEEEACDECGETGCDEECICVDCGETECDGECG
jgi:hypothetical protein